MWGNSDIPYLNQMTTPERIEQSTEKDIYFVKIGANISEISQLLDLGPFQKILKVSSKHLMPVGTEQPLSIDIHILYKKLNQGKIVSLSHLKECALKDLLIMFPDMVTSAFTIKSIIKVSGDKEWFMQMLPYLISEM